MKWGFALLLLIALTLSACGSSSSDTTSTAGRYVTAKDLSHYKPGTPQLATVQWWKAVQFGNAGVVNADYAPGAGPGLVELQRQLSAAASQFVGLPHFNSIDIRGNKATLYFFVTRPGSTAPPRPLSINLVQSGGEWHLADNMLLEQQVARVAKILRNRSS